MQFIGHSLATPGRTVYESIDCFRALGLDGMELLCRDGTDFAPGIDNARAVRMGDYANYNGLPIVVLSPDLREINHPDPAAAARACRELGRALQLADLLRARFVRTGSGCEQPADPEGAFARAVEALQQAGREAAARGLVLVVENHPGTVARSGTATRRLVDAVGLASVRALYDPANVLCDTQEPWTTTLAVQAGIIACVHAKDFDWCAGSRRTRQVGAGSVPWDRILRRLAATGYGGVLSLEYGDLLHPEDLADAEAGLAESLAYVRRCLAAAGGALS